MIITNDKLIINDLAREVKLISTKELTNHGFSSNLTFIHNRRVRIKFEGSCLKQDELLIIEI